LSGLVDAILTLVFVMKRVKEQNDEFVKEYSKAAYHQPPTCPKLLIQLKQLFQYGYYHHHR